MKNAPLFGLYHHQIPTMEVELEVEMDKTNLLVIQVSLEQGAAAEEVAHPFQAAMEAQDPLLLPFLHNIDYVFV
jgi:hypothetical protein